MFKFVLKTGLFLLVLALFLEGFFRTVVPASESPQTIQNREHHIMQYDVQGPREGLYTNGRLARHKAHWRVNNLGWISREDYSAGNEKQRPRAVIVGNSYVEAVYLDVDKHLAPVTKALMNDQCDFYTLGAWGVDLSQGIMVSDYAHKVLDPDLVVFAVSHGSLRRSVRNLANRPFCLQVEFNSEGQVEHFPKPFAPKRMGKILKKIALFRYVRMNAKFALGGGAQVETAFVKKTTPADQMTEAQRQEQELMSQGATWMVGSIREKFPESKFLFLVDADRNVIHQGEKPSPIPAAKHLSEALQGIEGIYMLDLTEVLFNDFQNFGIPLHESDNYHWNEHGVTVISKALADFIIEKKLLETE